jgi:hypothetical protein
VYIIITLDGAKQLVEAENQKAIQEKIAAIQAAKPEIDFSRAWELVKSQSPELFSTVEADTGSQRILDESQKLMDALPGLDRKNAIELLRHQKPELFDCTPAELEEEANLKTAQQKIRDTIAKLRVAEPHLSFAMAWHRLQSTNPELFESFEESES